MVKKIHHALRGGTFVKSLRYWLAKRIVSKENLVIENMNYVSETHRIHIQSSDFVRTGCLELTACEIIEKGIKGDVAELGVYRGDFAKLINEVFSDRKLYLFDTFEGFEKKDVDVDKDHNYSNGKQDFSGTSVDLVLGRMKHKDKVEIRKGWFPKTTEGLEKSSFVFVSIDADLFKPIYEGLLFFYPRMVMGGVIFVHDYNNAEYPGAAVAVKKFCDENEISYFCLPDQCGTAVILK